MSVDVLPEATAPPASVRELLAVIARRADAVDPLIDEAEQAGFDPADWVAQRLGPLVITADEVEPTDYQLSREMLSDRVLWLASQGGLSALDVAILLIGFSAVVDCSFQSRYTHLNNDGDTRAPAVSTALQLCGYAMDDKDARARFRSDRPLRKWGFIELSRQQLPLSSQLIIVSDRLASFLLGDDDIDDRVLAFSEKPSVPLLDWQLIPDRDSVRKLAGHDLVVVRAESGDAGTMIARRLLTDRTGFEPLIICPSQFAHSAADAIRDWKSCVREAAITGAGLVIRVGSKPPLAIADMLDNVENAAFPVVFLPEPDETSDWPRALPEHRVSRPDREIRRGWWQWAVPEIDTTEIADASTHLSPEAIWEIGQAARNSASEELTLADLRKAREGFGSKAVSRLCRRVTPDFTLADLVLPPEIIGMLEDLRDRARYRSVVFDDWGMRPGGGRGRGVTGLFSGSSGTGKSMAAEAIAGELGLPLFVVDISTVVDKYIGETEKNLEAVFAAVEQTDGVLLFDEADALFGKRSEVSDARDRHANVEVAYLLQRMEAFDGLAILTSNMRANLDEAFLRRLDAAIDFPEPDRDQRRQLWRSCLREQGTHLDDGTIDAVSELTFSGGSIRSASVAAAFLAASRGSKIDREVLVEGAISEWRKQGRLDMNAGLLDRLRGNAE